MKVIWEMTEGKVNSDGNRMDESMMRIERYVDMYS